MERKWPEGYEFPACKQCNDDARRDEQIVALLCRISFLGPDANPAEAAHFAKLLRGVANNAPEILTEMLGQESRLEQRRAFRRVLGDAKGDQFRLRGYHAASIGPLIRATLRRFQIKLGKALFYKHAGKILDGEMWNGHFTSAQPDFGASTIEALTRIAPLTVEIRRSGEELHDQFYYRYNISKGTPVLFYAVIQFSDQMIFNVIAADRAYRASRTGTMGILDNPQFADIHSDVRPQPWPDHDSSPPVPSSR